MSFKIYSINDSTGLIKLCTPKGTQNNFLTYEDAVEAINSNSEFMSEGFQHNNPVSKNNFNLIILTIVNK